MHMRGPSAEAAATLGDQLVAAVSEVGSRKAAQVGEELFGLADVLRTTPSLRRVVTDASVEGPAKVQLVRGLFEGKVDAITLDLLTTAVGLRWTATRDLPLVLENLGVVATVRSAEDAGRVADELFAFDQLLVENPDLRSTLSDPARSVEDKRRLIRGLLENRTLASSARLIEQSLTGTHRTASVAIQEYQKIAAAVHGESVAVVRAARELPDSELERLRTALTAQYGRDLHLNVVVEPDLIGGLRIEIGDDVIDGTVASRLHDARRRLAG
jgi:F-type H+-transporting ATPase subunit delta